MRNLRTIKEQKQNKNIQSSYSNANSIISNISIISEQNQPEKAYSNIDSQKPQTGISRTS